MRGSCIFYSFFFFWYNFHFNPEKLVKTSVFFVTLLLCPSSALCSNLRARPRRGGRPRALGAWSYVMERGRARLKATLLSSVDVSQILKSQVERQCEFDVRETQRGTTTIQQQRRHSESWFLFHLILHHFFLHYLASASRHKQAGSSCVLSGTCEATRGDGAVIDRRPSVCRWVNNKEKNTKGNQNNLF